MSSKVTVRITEDHGPISRIFCSAPLLVMAPEATTKSEQCLLKFRRGAFTSGSPVTPVLIHYHFRHFNPAWGICRCTPLHLYRLLAQVYNSVTMEVLPPYFPDAIEQEDWTVFAANVRVVMARALRAPMVEQVRDTYVSLEVYAWIHKSLE